MSIFTVHLHYLNAISSSQCSPLFQNGKKLHTENKQSGNCARLGPTWSERDHILRAPRSIRSPALNIGMNHMTLYRYAMQAQVIGSRNLQTGYRSPQRVFSTDQENVLHDYIIRSANIYFGLPPKDVRVLVYECALGFGVTIPNMSILLVSPQTEKQTSG